MAFIFTSCEKEEETVNNTNNDKSSLLVLIEKGHVDEEGIVGDLYYINGDPQKWCFCVYEDQPLPQAKKCEEKWTGHTIAIKINTRTQENPKWETFEYQCKENENPKDCRNVLQDNGQPGFRTALSVEQLSKL